MKLSAYLKSLGNYKSKNVLMRQRERGKKINSRYKNKNEMEKAMKMRDRVVVRDDYKNILFFRGVGGLRQKMMSLKLVFGIFLITLLHRESSGCRLNSRPGRAASPFLGWRGCR